ncbi:hypothetical protein MBLNU230_g0524t1 [Neophaeotheca triangularis]
MGEQPAPKRVNILTRDSYFSKVALSRFPPVARERKIKLPEADKTIFAAYLQWVYTEAIVITEPLRDSASDNEKKDHKSLVNTGLVKLYILADVLMTTPLRNALETLDQESRLLGLGMLKDSEAIKLVFSLTAECPLRRLVVDYYV